jgi:hypothetical protein
MIDVADRLAIYELFALYGHVIDERQWSDMDLVFTHDVVYDPSDFGHPVTDNLEDLRNYWMSDESMHPIGHHATNIVITEDPVDGVVRVLSKAIGIGRRGRAGSGVYRDVVVKTSDGWRLSHRRAELRRGAGE